MNRLIILIFSAFLFLETGFAQAIYPVNSPFNSIRQNGVSNILGAGDTLWSSPSLNFNVDNSID